MKWIGERKQIRMGSGDGFDPKTGTIVP